MRHELSSQQVVNIRHPRSEVMRARVYIYAIRGQRVKRILSFRLPL